MSTLETENRARREPFPKWIPAQVRKEARLLSESEAEAVLAPLLAALRPRP